MGVHMLLHTVRETGKAERLTLSKHAHLAIVT